jgi:phosphate-selective porin OprO/OprP
VIALLCAPRTIGQTALETGGKAPSRPLVSFGVPQVQATSPGALAPPASANALLWIAARPEPLAAQWPVLSDAILGDDGTDCPAPASQKRRHRLEAFWDNGLRFESDDDQFRLHVGGNAQIDSVWFMPPQSVFALPGGGMNGIGNANATFLRRARLRADGEIFGQFDYMAEVDFANAANDNTSANSPPSFSSLIGSPSPCNVWMQIRDVPVLGNVRAGYQVKPIGMTNNTSQALLPFLERADNMDAFYGPFDNGFALGVSARSYSESERVTWQYGVYRPLTNAFGVALNKYDYGGRITALPWYEGDGARLIHIGFGTWDGELVQDELRLRARPVLRNGPGFAVPVLADTGEIPGDKQYTLAPEFAMVLGSFTLQAEWAGQFLTCATPNGQDQGTLFFHGGYVQALYFLTGEVQPYAKRDGVFGRVIPRNDYHLRPGDAERGCGAWQVGVRFSYINLNDGAVQGGLIYDWTFGLNWYLNPNMRLQLNYILEHREGPTGTPVGWINGIGLRAGYDF